MPSSAFSPRLNLVQNTATSTFATPPPLPSSNPNLIHINPQIKIMSSNREAYQAPTGGATAIQAHNTSYDAATDGPAINYLCGDCNSKVSLKRAEPIRCKECGHRVLYKERTKRMVQFEAR